MSCKYNNLKQNERKSSPQSILVFPWLTISTAPPQGDRGEVGPPGPAGFAGPPVSKIPTKCFLSTSSSAVNSALFALSRAQMVSLVPREKLVRVDRRETAVLPDLRDHQELLDLWWVSRTENRVLGCKVYEKPLD